LPPVLDEVATCPSCFTPKWIKELVDPTAKVTNISSVSKYHTMPNTYGGWMQSSIHFQSCHQMKPNNEIYALAIFSKERVPSAHRMAAWVDPTAIWML